MMSVAYLKYGGAFQHHVDALAKRHVQDDAFGSLDLEHQRRIRKETSWRRDTRSSFTAERIFAKSMAVPLRDTLFDIPHALNRNGLCFLEGSFIGFHLGARAKSPGEWIIKTNDSL